MITFVKSLSFLGGPGGAFIVNLNIHVCYKDQFIELKAKIKRVYTPKFNCFVGNIIYHSVCPTLGKI